MDETESCRYQCEECGEAMSSNIRLIQHILSHRGSTVFCCEDCNEMFLSESQLEQHMTDLHSPNKAHKNTRSEVTSKYQCSECGKVFSSRKGLYQHQHVHMGKEFPCEACPCKFKWKGDLRRHLRNVHGLLLTSQALYHVESQKFKS